MVLATFEIRDVARELGVERRQVRELGGAFERHDVTRDRSA
jgi:hypothetical protein